MSKADCEFVLQWGGDAMMTGSVVWRGVRPLPTVGTVQKITHHTSTTHTAHQHQHSHTPQYILNLTPAGPIGMLKNGLVEHTSTWNHTAAGNQIGSVVCIGKSLKSYLKTAQFHF